MANATKVTIEYGRKKAFKKETGYDDLIKKVYEKTKSGKTKGFTANVSVAKMSFQAGKAKPPVAAIENQKIKVVKKGPVSDKVVVLATEGNAKKKTFVCGFRFANENDAKVFYDTAKLKGVKPKEPEPAPSPPSKPSTPSPVTPARSPPPPLTPTTTTQTMTDRRISQSRQSSPPRPAPIQQRNQSITSTSSRTSINNLQPAAPLPDPSPMRSPSRVSTRSSNLSLSRHYTAEKSKNLHSSTSSSSSSSSSYAKRQTSAPPKQESRPAYQEYSPDARTTFVSTDPNDYMTMNGRRHHRKRRPAPPPASSPNGNPPTLTSKDSDTGTHQSRKSAESVRILQLMPGKNQNRPKSGRMYYYSARLDSPSGSISRSSSSSSSSSESIATRWMRARSAPSRKQDRTFGYRVRGGNDDYVEFTPRDYKSRPEPRIRRSSRSSSSSSSSSSCSSSSSESPKIVGQWRIQKIFLSRSSSSSSASSTSDMDVYHPSQQGKRSGQRRASLLITPR